MPTSRDEQDKRRMAIVKILKEDEPIRQQKELVRKLVAMGIPATQSSVSRDLSEIGAVRIRNQWMLIGMYDVGLFEKVAEQVTEVKFAGPNLTLLVTRPGAGPVVAQVIQDSGWEEVEGTVAGVNSVLVLTYDDFFQKLFSTRLQGYLRDRRNEEEGEPFPGTGSWRVSRKFT